MAFLLRSFLFYRMDDWRSRVNASGRQLERIFKVTKCRTSYVSRLDVSCNEFTSNKLLRPTNKQNSQLVLPEARKQLFKCSIFRANFNPRFLQTVRLELIRLDARLQSFAEAYLLYFLIEIFIIP